jgi:DNA adenine methylase
MTGMKPFLKWAGNKYRCIEHIINALPQGKRLIEPFAGSCAVFLNTNFKKYLLADTNQDLATLYRQLIAEGEPFISYCARYFTKENNTKEKYYYLRAQFNQCKQPRKRAALFLYLNRHGYNGLCRYNQQGGYNVPFGRYIKPYFPTSEMRYFHQKGFLCTIINSDFRQTFKQARKGDIIYCDPPYVPLSKSANFTSYTNRAFGEQEQIELSELALQTAERGIPVIISNHDTPFTRYHYSQSEITTFNVTRLISCMANKRKAVRELIAIYQR